MRRADSRTRRRVVVNKYGQGVSLMESILLGNMPHFLQIIKRKPVVAQRLEVDDMELVPPSASTYPSIPYRFRSIKEIDSYIQKTSKEDISTLYRKVRKILAKYIVTDERNAVLIACDIIFSYFQDKFPTTHYLFLVGDTGSGKNAILLVFLHTGYRVFYVVGASAPNIFQFLGTVEECQGTIAEDELDYLDTDPDKTRILKTGYTTGARVPRITSVDTREMQYYYTYCFKIMAAEKEPDYQRMKGFLDRCLRISSYPGIPKHNIKEVISSGGDNNNEVLRKELEDLHKTLLIYRLIHYNSPIPDVKLNVGGREGELIKPIVRLFQDTGAILDNEVLPTLANFLREKRKRKRLSLDSLLFNLVNKLIQEQGEQLSNELIWSSFMAHANAHNIPNKPFSCYSEDCGEVSHRQITKILEDKFGGEKRHNGKERIMRFNTGRLRSLAANYSELEEIRILDRDNTSNTTNGSRDRKKAWAKNKVV